MGRGNVEKGYFILCPLNLETIRISSNTCPTRNTGVWSEPEFFFIIMLMYKQPLDIFFLLIKPPHRTTFGHFFSTHQTSTQDPTSNKSRGRGIKLSTWSGICMLKANTGTYASLCYLYNINIIPICHKNSSFTSQNTLYFIILVLIIMYRLESGIHVCN